MEPSFTTRAESFGCSVVVHVNGDIDLTTSGQLRDDMSRLVGGGPNLVVDLAEVPFVDSEGLSALLATRSALLQRGGSLAVRNPSRTVRRMLDVAGLAGMLIESTQREDGPESANQSR